MFRCTTNAIIGLFAVMLFGLAGCGGGSASSSSNTTSATAKTVTGVAATGTAIAGTVYLKDSSSPSQEISTPINADGTFSFDVTNLTAPYLLKAVGTASGQNYTLYSVAGAPGVANINPLSHLAVVQANGGADPAALYATLTPVQLQAIKSALATVIPQIQALLQQILTQYGVASTDFISDPYTANHTGLDLLFDMVSIIANNGSLTISNKLSGSSILSTTLNGNTLSGQVVTSNIPIVSNQMIGAVYIFTSSVNLYAGGSSSFKAIVIGTTNQTATWSVLESNGGTITSGGVYTAPSVAGTYHIRATSPVDSTKYDTATVTVNSASSTYSYNYLKSIGGSVSVGGSYSTGITGLAVDTSGNLYAVDGGLNCIYKFAADGTFIKKIGSAGSGNGQFSAPFGIAIGPDGNLYVTDSLNYRVQVLTPDGTFVRKWGSFNLYSGGSNGYFGQLTGIAVDTAGNVYVADMGDSCVQKFKSDGTFISSFGSYGLFDFISGLAVDNNGNVFVANSGRYNVCKFSSSGTYLTSWGSQGTADGLFAYGISGISVDAAGNVFVVDGNNDRIQKFDNNGKFITNWGAVGAGNQKLNIGLTNSGIAVDSAGGVYIADIFNMVIKKYLPAS